MKITGIDVEVEEILASKGGIVRVFGSAPNHPYSVCIALADKYAQVTISEAVELARGLVLAAKWAYENSSHDGVWISKNNGDDIREMGIPDVKIMGSDN